MFKKWFFGNKKSSESEESDESKDEPKDKPKVEPKPTPKPPAIMHKCDCGRIFATADALKRHRARRPPVPSKPKQCIYCDAKYIGPDEDHYRNCDIYKYNKKFFSYEDRANKYRQKNDDRYLRDIMFQDIITGGPRTKQQHEMLYKKINNYNNRPKFEIKEDDIDNLSANLFDLIGLLTTGKRLSRQNLPPKPPQPPSRPSKKKSKPKLIKKLVLPSGNDIKAPDDAPESDVCKMCLENVVQTINLPCGHMFFCIGCANKYGNERIDCPVCEENMTEVKRFFK